MTSPWIDVRERLPDDGATVAFVVSIAGEPGATRHDYLHRRVLGGTYRAGRFGGFSTPGLTVDASHWMPLPPPPDAL